MILFNPKIATAGSKTQFLLPISGRQKTEFAVLIFIWLAATAHFWKWWLSPEHNFDNLRFLINTLALFWTTWMPANYLYFLRRLKIPNPNVPLPNVRVAMVVTKVPSEPLSLLKKTLIAMLAQKYPHDTWLADEQPDTETIAWCKANHVQISTRFGNKDYHNKSWPRRTKCKEGNLAYFYDHYGYDNYDIVAQLDADHIPSSGYLEEMIRPFADPKVGYVSAPSICDSNASDSFWARSRLFKEGLIQGVLQAGYFTPLCIGSHYALRTQALADIGGLGPELAEDFTTSMFLCAKKWRGVHAINAFAHGEGPGKFEDFIIQEFQWSRSLTTILLRYYPKCVKDLPTGIQIQFLFNLLWYPLFAGFMALIFLLPIIALCTKSVYANIIFIDFLWRASLIAVSFFLILFWIKKNRWLRPMNCKIISWEGTIFLFANWPFVLLGCVDAIISFLRKKESEFRVTPKGKTEESVIPVNAILPYILLSISSALPVILIENVGNATGFYFFASFNSILYAVILAIIISNHNFGLQIWRTGLINLLEAVKHFGQGLNKFRLNNIQIPEYKSNQFTVLGLTLLTFLSAGDTIYQRAEIATSGLLWGWQDGFSTKPAIDKSRLGVNLGVYDNTHQFANSNLVAIEHIFVSWLEDNKAEIELTTQYAKERNRWVMITVEPYVREDAVHTTETLFIDIQRGHYDNEIKRVCSSITDQRRPVLIRWGHEMDRVNGRYPWAQHDADGFADSYRYFVTMCRAIVPEAWYLWSPISEGPKVHRYWPGKEYVDFIGLSVFGFPEWDLDRYGRLRSFADIFDEKYQWISIYKKNIVVAELGVTGDTNYQKHWMDQLFRDLKNYPLLKTLVYFNSRDNVGAWEDKYSVPDWRIANSVFD